MPFPDPFMPMVLIVAIAGTITTCIFNFSSSAKIRETHTHFALKQIVERIDQLDESKFPQATADLINFLRSSNIDWNSCRIDGERILDGWGRPISAAFNRREGRWLFHSLGKDGKGETADDIEFTTGEDSAVP